MAMPAEPGARPHRDGRPSRPARHRGPESAQSRMGLAFVSLYAILLLGFGILPTLSPELLTHEAISTNPRYALLDQQMLLARGEEILWRVVRRLAPRRLEIVLPARRPLLVPAARRYAVRLPRVGSAGSGGLTDRGSHPLGNGARLPAPRSAGCASLWISARAPRPPRPP